jgi:tRNA A37 threonylcarbamoyladenosine synthetase subunit TsaC/SUA5/YrdC
MLLQVHPEDPQPRHIKTIVDVLEKGGVIIYPYGHYLRPGCDIFQHKAIEKNCRIKKIDPPKAQLSFICYDLGDLSAFQNNFPEKRFGY